MRKFKPNNFRSCLFAAALALATTNGTASTLTLLPPDAELSGPGARQQFLALETGDGRSVGEAASPSFNSSDPKIVEIDPSGLARAVGDGQATITVRDRQGRTAQTTIKVAGTNATREWSFRNHVLPVFSKAGCNSGACHGALAGKGGFRLSLRGYDPNADHYTITREARGRRVELGDPARSLILAKPTTLVKHKGGKRLDPASRNYRILAEWIANGAEPPRDSDPELARLEVLPKRSTLQPGDSQRLLVRAFYSDGRQEDVTQWARFSSTDETIATVDEKTGEVSVIGYGEGALTVWFSSRIVIARVTSPFPHTIPDSVFAEVKRGNDIDNLVLDQLRQLNLRPSPPASDSEFIRRAFLDTVGLLPSAGETRQFLEDPSPDKRQRLIDRLLSGPEFTDYWTYRWADVFLINGRLLRPEAVKAYYLWLRKQVEQNTPWDELVRQIVTARGNALEQGAVNFYSVHQDPETMAENVSQAFLSLSIGCAKCHNHPLEKWTNDQYYSFANLFARVRGKGWGGDPRNGNGARTLYVADRGDLIQPRTGKPQPPAPLDAKPIPHDSAQDRREVLADWLTDPDNPYFTKSIVNRVWAACFGKGLVNPIDDLRISNPPTNEPLLDALCDYLVKNNYDLKALLRLILTSQTYQRSSEALPENRDDSRYFARHYPRRLMAEVLHDAIAGITSVPTRFDAIALRDGSQQKTEFYNQGTGALQLYDSAVASYFLKTFGRNEREITCECERSNQPSMVQVLHLSNGDTLNKKLSDEQSRLARLLESERTPSEIVDEAYLLCLSRFPTERERNGMMELFQDASGKDARAVLEDLFWALMTSREFLFQH